MESRGRRTVCFCGGQRDRGDTRSGALAPIHEFGPADRARALEQLARFASHDRWIVDAERSAMEVFFGMQRGDPALRLLRMHLDATSRRVYAAWLFFDLRFDDGWRMVEHFLDASGARLGPGERAYVRAALASCMQLFEVTAAERGALALHDVLAGARMSVAGRMPPNARPGDLLAARIVPCGRSGHPAFDGAPLVIHRALRDILVDVLYRARSDLVAANPEASDLRFWETLPPLIHHVWLQTARTPAAVEIMDRDRDRAGWPPRGLRRRKL